MAMAGKAAGKRGAGGKVRPSKERAPDPVKRLAGLAAAFAADADHPAGDEALQMVDNWLEAGRLNRLEDALRAADELGFEAFECLRELIEHAASHVAVSVDGRSDAEGGQVLEARLYAVVLVGPAAAFEDALEAQAGSDLVAALQRRGLIAESAQASFARSVLSPAVADGLDWGQTAELAAELFDCHAQQLEPPEIGLEAEVSHDTSGASASVRLLGFASFEDPADEALLEAAEAGEAEQAWLSDAAAILADAFDCELDLIGVFPWFAALRMAVITQRSLEIRRILQSIAGQSGIGPGALRPRLNVFELDRFQLAIRLGLDEMERGRRLVTADFPVLTNEHAEEAWAALVQALVEQDVREPG